MADTNNEIKRICLVIPSLGPGGMERVMSEIANYLSSDDKLDIHLILYSKRKPFYTIASKVRVHQPKFETKSKIVLIFKNFFYLRSKLKEIRPYSILSFGSMYNSFTLLASLLLGIKVYVSDRSNPYRNTILTFKKDLIINHDGILHYLLKKILYRLAAGILVQTKLAEKIESEFSGNKNIIFSPNPIREIKDYPSLKKEKWILNVGRFVKTKNQLLLIKIFSKVQNTDWKLVFVGDGPELNKAKKMVAKLNLEESVIFSGYVKDIDRFLRKSQIFAFTSLSEGFPNALAEGMKASLACIAFDCIAGPRDLIQDGQNGFLIAEGSIDRYKKELLRLMMDDELRARFQEKAKKSMDKYKKEIVIKGIKEELISK